MFFKKKCEKIQTKDEKELLYFKYRDSLTGLMNKTYAIKEYDKLKGMTDFGAIMVRLSGCDNMPMYKAENYIQKAGALLPRIYNGEISRVEYGDFLMFTDSVQSKSEKLEFFLTELSENGQRYTVVADMFDQNETFDLFLRRIRRHMAAVEYGNMRQML